MPRHPAQEAQGTSGLGFAFDAPFPALSNVKQKLWPPVPDLHRALGSFLHESSKHGQVRGQGQRSLAAGSPGGSSKGSAYRTPLCVCVQANAFYKQPSEEAVLPCLLEVLPGPRLEAEAPPEQAAGRTPSTDIANQSYLLMSGWEPRGPR